MSNAPGSMGRKVVLFRWRGWLLVRKLYPDVFVLLQYFLSCSAVVRGSTILAGLHIL